jgi:hypothetical protein
MLLDTLLYRVRIHRQSSNKDRRPFRKFIGWTGEEHDWVQTVLERRGGCQRMTMRNLIETVKKPKKTIRAIVLEIFSQSSCKGETALMSPQVKYGELMCLKSRIVTQIENKSLE